VSASAASRASSQAPSQTATATPSLPPVKGPLDFPRISQWLTACEEDIERGRDGHQYKSLVPLFADNECTRIDDIARMTPGVIRELSKEMGINASIGLVNRVHQYAVEDVAQVRLHGKLV